MTFSKDDQIQALQDRVAELEDLLGVSEECGFQFRKLGLPWMACQILGFMVKRDLATRQALFTAIYGARPESEQPTDDRGIDVRIWNIRNALEPHGIKIRTELRRGWSMTADDKARLQALMQSLNADLPPTHCKKQSIEGRRL